jgi:CelD/BcsL family acetyltransferase involved in cellulose biosynthesis
MLNASTLAIATEWVTGVEGLESLRANWISLQDTGGAFCRYEWFEAYLRYLARSPGQIGFVSCTDACGPLAIVPAAPVQETIRPFGQVHALTLGTHSHLAILDFPLSPRADPVKVGEAVIVALKRLNLSWSVIHWGRSPMGGNAWRVATALQGRAFIRPGPPSNGFDTTLSFEALQAGWSKNLRTSLQKSRKRLNEARPWGVVSSRDAEDQERFFDEFLRLEASGWKGQSGTGSAIAITESYRAFYNGLLHGRKLGLDCEITLLEAGGRAIAAQFSISAQRCKHILKIGYDEGAGKFSPGQVLLEEVLKRACDDTRVDRVSLVTDMPWHKTWRAQALENFEGLIFRRRTAMLVYRIALRSKSIARALTKRFKSKPSTSK